jgi:hypothetical protein
MFVQLCARTYPEDVAAVVFENPVPPAEFWLTQASAFMTEQEQADKQVDFAEGAANEDFDFTSSYVQIDAAGPLPDVPFLVLISTIAQCGSPDDICGRTYGVYETLMGDLARSWPQGKFLQVEGGHDLYLQPAAIDAIGAVIEAVRDPNSWTASATPSP